MNESILILMGWGAFPFLVALITFYYERVPVSKKPKCAPTTYNVVNSLGAVTYGWRCAFHGIPSKRYATEALRDQRLAEHIAESDGSTKN